MSCLDTHRCLPCTASSVPCKPLDAATGNMTQLTKVHKHRRFPCSRAPLHKNGPGWSMLMENSQKPGKEWTTMTDCSTMADCSQSFRKQLQQFLSYTMSFFSLSASRKPWCKEEGISGNNLHSIVLLLTR